MSFLGKKHTERTKRKMSESMKGLHHPNLNQKGNKNPSWKGGRTKNKGRVYVLNHNHPHAGQYGYVLRSHLIMEKMLGRFLNPEEVVHHKNYIKDDDRPENLKLFQSKREHVAFHNHVDKKGTHYINRKVSKMSEEEKEKRHKISNREYYQKNREKMREKHREYYLKNRGQRRNE